MHIPNSAVNVNNAQVSHRIVDLHTDSTGEGGE